MLLGLGLSHLILGVRTQSKGETAAKSLREKYPSSTFTIDVFLLDMESYASIEDFARRCGTLSRIDFAILNAGCSEETFKTVKATGHERLMQINFLSTMLLTTLLLPVLKAKAPPSRPSQLTIVSSGLSLHAKLPQHTASRIIPAFDVEKDFDPVDQYSTSKVLIHLFLDQLVQYVRAEDVVVNTVDPGLVKGTQLHRELRSISQLLLGTFKWLAGRTLQAGASTYIDAAVVRGRETHGCFLMNWKIYPYGNFYYCPQRAEVQSRLWKEMMEEFKFARMEETIKSMAE